MINKDTYELFCKHGSELLWLSDPTREPRPKGTNKNTDEEFIVLERLDQSIELFHNSNYVEKQKKEFIAQIKNLKTKVSDEVFRMIEDKYRKH